MKKLYAALFTMLFCVANTTAQQLQPLNKEFSLNYFKNKKKPNAVFKTHLCGLDTVEYTVAKATGLAALEINGSTSAEAISQYYNCPQPLDISGMTFYGYKIDGAGGVSANVPVYIYAAGPDSMPTGPPLATTNVVVDTTYGGGSLAAIKKVAVFAPTVTITVPYVIVVEHTSPNGIALVFNNWTVGDGGGEFLASARIGATWMRGWDLNVGGSQFDCDAIFQPHVEYNISTTFNQSATCITVVDSVDFTNTASPIYFDRMYSQAAFIGTPETQFSWDYGDGSPLENVISPTHTYTIADDWTVMLTGTMEAWITTCQEDSSSTLGSAPVSDFTDIVNSLVVDFFDASSPNAVTYLWDLGDGNTSTLQNPTHTYTAVGNYYVCLTTTNGCGTHMYCDSIIAGCTTPIAGLSASVTDLNANFSDGSSGAPDTWAWDFGDGNSSTLQNPTHVYATQGTYVVCLTSSNFCGTTTDCDTITIVCPPPSPDFSASINMSTATFTDASGGSPTTWSWFFGDGQTSNLQNPTHTYVNAGTYLVCLQTANNCGDFTFCDTITVTGCPTPGTDFTAVQNGASVDFTDNSTASPTSWMWFFGDGNSSSMQNPTHIYANAGVYLVCLEATNGCGTTTYCDTVSVAGCPLPVSSFSSNENQGDVDFTDNTSGSPSAWEWFFGDGNSSNAQNPTHTYAANGTYFVCLITTNACGVDTGCASITVTTVGIEDLIFNNLQIYPNPADQELHLSFNSSSSEVVTVELYDLTGKLVKSESTNPGTTSTTLNVAELSAAIYHLRVSEGDRSNWYKVVVAR